MSWNLVKMNIFLKERQGRYKPYDKEISDLQRIDKIDFSGNIYLSEKPSKTNMILVKPGDLVISGINVEKGAMSVYIGDKDVIATIHYSSYIYNADKIDINFLKHFLKSPKFKEALKNQVPGGIKTELKPKHILPLEVYIPTSLDEQKQIVNYLDIQFRRFNRLTKELTHQLELVKQLRQSFLREAMQGKLVPQDAGEEAASALLERIKTEKAELIKQKKIKKQKPLAPISDEEIPFEIPENWVWCRLGEMIDIKRPLTYGIVKMGNPPKNNGVYALRSSDIKYRYIDLSKVRKVKSEISNQYTRTILQGNEILLNVRGTLGGCAITNSTLCGFNIAREIAMIALHNQNLNNFVFNVLTSPFFRDEVNKNLRGIAYKGLNLNLLNSFLIPLPPLSEQKRIVEKMDGLMKYCDQLEESIKASQKQNEQLLQQVLREALEPGDA